MKPDKKELTAALLLLDRAKLRKVTNLNQVCPFDTLNCQQDPLPSSQLVISCKKLCGTMFPRGFGKKIDVAVNCPCFTMAHKYIKKRFWQHLNAVHLTQVPKTALKACQEKPQSL